ncbi:hypothetical protein Tco_1466157 [Tanacetum coccineum]
MIGGTMVLVDPGTLEPNGCDSSASKGSILRSDPRSVELKCLPNQYIWVQHGNGTGTQELELRQLGVSLRIATISGMNNM